MGIYGQGAAFNLRCQAREASLPAKRYMAPPPPTQKTVIIKQPVMQMPTIGMPGIVGQNVTINNGPQNPLAAFCGGAFGGFFNSLIRSDNSQAAKPEASVDYLSNLKTLFPKNAVVDDGGGKYTIVKDDGTNFSGTYQEIKAEMNKKDEVKPQGDKPEVKPEEKSEVKSEVKPDTKPDDKADAGNKAAKTPKSKSPAAKKSGSASPDGWYRANNSNEGSIGNLVQTGSTPRQVLDKILKGKCDYLSEADRNKLAAELLQKNPSIFKDGKVKAGAELNKLDIPSIKYIKNNHAKNTKKIDSGVVKYQDKDGAVKTGASKINLKKGDKMIQGKNGYFAVYNSSGAKFYDNNGDPVSPKDFKKLCKGMYKIAMAPSAARQRARMNDAMMNTMT